MQFQLLPPGSGGQVLDVHGQADDGRRRLSGSRRPGGDRLLPARVFDRPKILDARLSPGPHDRPATDGTFSVKGLPSGEYYLAALTDLEAGEWNDPTLLDQLVKSSAKVTLRDGETTTQDLRIGGS